MIIVADKHGNLSINSDNIFPIIKKWLYSDHDIFLQGADLQRMRRHHQAEKAGHDGGIYPARRLSGENSGTC